METRLDQLHPGERGRISRMTVLSTKTRKRYAALGLTPGTMVRLYRSAPAGDPIAIHIRGYTLSLRRTDAGRIFLGRDDDASDHKTERSAQLLYPEKHIGIRARQLTAHCCRKGCPACPDGIRQNGTHRTIRAALAGNPNCGKTTLFNTITGARESVGNRPGVTVEKRERYCTVGALTVRITDLPGIYSLQNSTAEERTARDHLRYDAPDAILNIADATNLARNLFLTVELRALGKPMVLALNMMDEAEAKGLRIDHGRLAELLGIPVVPICARSGDGLDALLSCLCMAADADTAPQDRAVSETDAAAVYAYIDRVCEACILPQKEGIPDSSDRIDALLLHPVLGIPMFLSIMGLVFVLTFDTVGGFLSDGMQRLISAGLQPKVQAFLSAARVPDAWAAFLLFGLLGGIGNVLSFLPQVAILFFFLSLLEDSGYLARAAFLTDRTLRRFGLSGKACIPLLMGFGCTVPAALATRTMERDADRCMTLFLLPCVSCSAKLPVYGMIAYAMFPKCRGIVVLSLYLLGLAAGALIGSLLQGSLFSRSDAAFVLELPPYRMPTARNTFLQIAERLEHFLKRAGTLILLMNLLLWLLLHLDGGLQITADPTQSLLARFGMRIAPLFAPLGFGSWQAAVAILTGFAAKEAVTASLSLLSGISSPSAANALSALFTPASAYAFLVFLLLSLPCAAALTTLLREWNDRRYGLLFVLLQSTAAYLTAYLAYTILRLFGM